MRSDRFPWIMGLYLLLIVTVVGFSIFRGIFVGEDEAIRALEKQGYNDVKIESQNWLFVGLRGCDERDAAKFTAEVTNPAGKRTEVFVCVGWPFKGATVRTD